MNTQTRIHLQSISLALFLSKHTMMRRPNKSVSHFNFFVLMTPPHYNPTSELYHSQRMVLAMVETGREDEQKTALTRSKRARVVWRWGWWWWWIWDCSQRPPGGATVEGTGSGGCWEVDQDFMGSLPSGFFPCFSNSALKQTDRQTWACVLPRLLQP